VGTEAGVAEVRAAEAAMLSASASTRGCSSVTGRDSEVTRGDSGEASSLEDLLIRKAEDPFVAPYFSNLFPTKQQQQQQQQVSRQRRKKRQGECVTWLEAPAVASRGFHQERHCLFVRATTPV